MSIDFIRPEVDELRPRISVIGVGGAGGNAVANSFSGILGPIITGILVDAAGYDGAFYVAAAVAIFGGIWWLVAIPRIAQVIPKD